jgi:hypothetical protein
MSREDFVDDPSYVKKVTNPESDGVGRYDGPQNLGSGNPAPYYEVSVKEKPGSGSDTIITHTGPGAGNMGGVGNATDVQGFVSATGNRVVIDNTFGADTITLQHHSGATIIIDSDGSIHLVSSGKKGVGVIAPKGDATMYAKGHLILKGDGKITIETEGDLEFNVGGTLSYHVGGDMITNVRGSVDESIDGSKSFEIAKDMSTMVAGDNRITSAGKMRIQSSKSLEIDAADDITVRTDHNLITASQQATTISSIQAMTLNSRDKFTALSVAAMDLETQDTFTSKSSGNMDIESGGTYTVISQGAFDLNSQDILKASSSGNMTVETQGNFASKSSGTTKISSQGDASVHSAATANFFASGLIQIKGSDTDIQLGGSTSPDAAGFALAPSSPQEAAVAPLAQYAPANTIIDNVTSLRVAPDFPKNANKMSAEEFSLYKNEGYPNPQAEAYAAGNKGAGAVYSTQDSGITSEAVASGIYDRPAGIGSNNGVAEQNPYPMPTSIYNSNEKLSRHVTIGQIIGLRDVPASNQKQVLTQAMNVAWNILDPLYEKFGGRMMITSWYRDNSPNHIKGGAVDIRCVNKPDYGFTAELAAYVRDNLPFNKVLLEKNDQGGIHCHVESAQPGQQGGGTVLTCADPHCSSSVPGIQLSYAVAALEGRSYAG